MIIRGMKAIREHMKSLQPRWVDEGPNGVNIVGDHDEDYVVDALFDIPNR